MCVRAPPRTAPQAQQAACRCAGVRACTRRACSCAAWHTPAVPLRVQVRQALRVPLQQARANRVGREEGGKGLQAPELQHLFDTWPASLPMRVRLPCHAHSTSGTLTTSVPTGRAPWPPTSRLSHTCGVAETSVHAPAHCATKAHCGSMRTWHSPAAALARGSSPHRTHLDQAVIGARDNDVGGVVQVGDLHARNARPHT